MRTDAATAQGPSDDLRVGVDLASIGEVAASVDRFGDRYLHRLFNTNEIDDCHPGSPGFASSLAARFAAKEAVLKALAVDSTAVPAWKDISVVRRPSGACSLELRGTAEELARQRSISSWSLSMSHEGSVAVAVAVAVCAAGPSEACKS